MKVKILTLGCKVNQFESQAMYRLLSENGYTIVDDDQPADIAVVNSCAVTQVSEQKTVKLLHRLRRESPFSVIVLTGCMAQTMTEAQKRLPEADIILGNKRRSDLIPVLKEYFERKERLTCIEPYQKQDTYEPLMVDDFLNRTRAFLKIEDGCNRFCSYCIIPYARGRVRSCSLEYIREEITALSQKGYREVVLIGINLSSYGQDNGLNLADAIAAACETADIRIRLGSLEPESMDLASLERLSKYKNFCPHFHLALQSGCDATLRRMNRHYTTAEYAAIVSNIRSIFENPSLTTDVMVGFPGETEEEFAQSLSFVEQTGFAKVHIFPYSRRPGTAADRQSGHLPPDIKKDRAARMAEVTHRTTKAFLQSQIGRLEPVLTETRRQDGLFEGYTMNYTPVHFPASPSHINQILPLHLTSLDPSSSFLLGHL